MESVVDIVFFQTRTIEKLPSGQMYILYLYNILLETYNVYT